MTRYSHRRNWLTRCSTCFRPSCGRARTRRFSTRAASLASSCARRRRDSSRDWSRFTPTCRSASTTSCTSSSSRSRLPSSRVCSRDGVSTARSTQTAGSPSLPLRTSKATCGIATSTTPGVISVVRIVELLKRSTDVTPRSNRTLMNLYTRLAPRGSLI